MYNLLSETWILTHNVVPPNPDDFDYGEDDDYYEEAVEDYENWMDEVDQIQSNYSLFSKPTSAFHIIRVLHSQLYLTAEIVLNMLENLHKTGNAVFTRYTIQFTLDNPITTENK